MTEQQKKEKMVEQQENILIEITKSEKPMNLRWRHLRKNDGTKTPVGTMAILEERSESKDDKKQIFIGFVFCGNRDSFKKWFGRSLSTERVAGLAKGNKEQKYALETTRKKLIEFITLIKERKITSSQGYRRLAKKVFGLKEKKRIHQQKNSFQKLLQDQLEGMWQKQENSDLQQTTEQDGLDKNLMARK